MDTKERVAVTQLVEYRAVTSGVEGSNPSCDVKKLLATMLTRLVAEKQGRI